MSVPICQPLEPRRLLSFGPLTGELHLSGSVITSRPDVACDPAGNFAAVWESWADPEDLDVVVRLFNDAGAPRGRPQRVNTTTQGVQHQPRLAMDSAGNFVVVWVDESTHEVRARRYSSSGAAQGGELLVSDLFVGYGPLAPAVAMEDGGGFVVAWTIGADVFFRRYDEAGAALAPPQRLFAPAVGASPFFVYADVAVDGSGNFVVAWELRYTIAQGGGTNSTSDVFAQRFDAQGVARGAAFRAHRAPSGIDRAERNPAVAMDHAGNFLIAWDGVEARRFDATGAPLGREFRVSPYSIGAEDPAIAMSPGGEAVVTWTRPLLSEDDTHFQRLRADGSADGFPVRTSLTTASQQAYARAAMRDDGDFVIVWSSPVQNGTQNHGIFGRLYGGDTEPAPGPAPDLIAASDSGVSQTDDITNDVTPTFVGAAPPGALVRLLDDETEVAAVTAGADGTYTVTAPTLASHYRRFRVAVAAPGSVEVLSSPLYVIIDTVAPSAPGRRFHYQTAPQRVVLPFGEDVEGGVTDDDVSIMDRTHGGADVPRTFNVDDSGQFVTLTFPDFPGGVLDDADYHVTLSATGATDLAGNPLALPFVFDFYFLMCDAQPSRRVDLFDFNLLAYAFGTTRGATFSQGDFNYDGRVDLDDFGILASRFGNVLPPVGPLMSFTPGASGLRGAADDDGLDELLR